MKPFYIYNTLSREVEEFRPLKSGEVTYYSCGPTVYLPPHLGNMRSFLVADTLKRALEFNGYKVHHVMNITDVGHMTTDQDGGEDKIEKTARAEGRSPLEVANYYIAQFKGDLERLRWEEPEVLCRATEHVPEMISLIERIVGRGFAYVTPSGVYFDVVKYRGGNRPGRLSRQTLEEQHTEQRIEHSPDKKSPHDFALWVLNQPNHIMQWNSPWGRGYPGWHIECSAMSMKYLGETLDIHSGGLDHVPVHHEDEIAQSESATGKPFARYFVHNAFLVGAEGAKISKSAGKFPLLSDLIAAGIHPLAFRLFLLSAKYRSELALSEAAVRGAETNLFYIYNFASTLPDSVGDADADWVEPYIERFTESLNHDLNTPQALAVVLELVAEAYKRDDKRIWQALTSFDKVLGLDLAGIRAEAHRPAPDAVAELAAQRDQARRVKDYKRADAVRGELLSQGWVVEDTPSGYRLKRRWTAG